MDGWRASRPLSALSQATARCCLAPRFLPHRRGLITTRCSPAPAPHWPHLAFLAVISEIIPRPAVNCHRSAAAAAACALTRDHSFSRVSPGAGSRLHPSSPLLYSHISNCPTHDHPQPTWNICSCNIFLLIKYFYDFIYCKIFSVETNLTVLGRIYYFLCAVWMINFRYIALEVNAVDTTVHILSLHPYFNFYRQPNIRVIYENGLDRP